MTRTKTKPDDEAQKKRFIEKARELGTDESEEAFERAFKKLVPQRPRTRRKQKP